MKITSQWSISSLSFLGFNSEWENSLNMEHTGKKLNPLKQKDMREKLFFRDSSSAMYQEAMLLW